MGNRGVDYTLLQACGRINHPKYGPCQCAINKSAHKLETGEIVWLRRTEHLALHPELWPIVKERHELEARLEEEKPAPKTSDNQPIISWDEAGKWKKTWR